MSGRRDKRETSPDIRKVDAKMPIVGSEKLETFMDYVQFHERIWGTEVYAGRPNLVDLLQTPVVVFWQVAEESRYTVTLHDNLDEIEQYFAKLLMRSTLAPPKQRVVRIFAGGKQVRIKAVKVEFEVVE